MKLKPERRSGFIVMLALILMLPFIMLSCKTGTTTNKSKTIYAKDYGLMSGEDAVPALRKALDACIGQQATKLVIPEGEYDCFPDITILANKYALIG